MERGGHLLIERALAGLAPGDQLEIRGRAPHLQIHLRSWCRARGHEVVNDETSLLIAKGSAGEARRQGASRAGSALSSQAGAVADAPPARWGLAARGALVEAGTPHFRFHLDRKEEVWADDAGELYRQALAAQWHPDQAIPWTAPLNHPDEVEDALVQVLTYLIENETAALIVPARFASQVHPHFREIMQVLAIQAADEARHIEVFTRRALLRRRELGSSTAGGQSSLQTLIEEPDFETASFLLSVLGEGTFVNLLAFLRRHAPDPCSAEIFRLTSQDEARHVAFAMAHLLRHTRKEPQMLSRFAAAIEHRHDALRDTAGLNEEVFDSLVLLAAGGWSPDQIGRGHDAVSALTREMDSGRTQRLQKLGFAAADAAALSALHTRNFM